MKERVLSILSKNKALVRVLLSDGLYFAKKVNDDYTVLHETSEGWRALTDGQEPNGGQVIILAEVEDQKTSTTRTIAVNADFVNWPVKTNFVFRVVNGKTQLVLNTFTDAKMKEIMVE